jgi:hypothetical protein
MYAGRAETCFETNANTIPDLTGRGGHIFPATKSAAHLLYFDLSDGSALWIDRTFLSGRNESTGAARAV